MAGATGFEPATSAVTGQRSNQLSYAPVTNGTRKVFQFLEERQPVFFENKKTRATNAQEVGVGNSSEENADLPEPVLK
jgi:hypothetical protein